VAITLVNIGTGIGKGDGDVLRVAFTEIDASLTDLDTRLAGNTALIGTLGGAAFLSIGTDTGTVADGGALAAEILRAQAAEQANTTLINNEISRAQSAELLKAPIASPTFTGVPRAPTATAGSGGTQIATLDFVATAVASVPVGGGGVSGTPTSRQILASGLATGGGDLTADRTITVPKAAQSDVAAGTDDTKALTSLSVAAALGAKAPLASPALVGTPTAPTAALGTSTSQLATTGFVAGSLGSYAPLASPALTGTPTAPTQAAADNSTKIATTAYADRAAVAYTPPSGSVVNYTRNTTAAPQAITSVTPFDDTIPQASETTSIVTVTHTPRAATNLLHVHAVLQGAASAQANIAAAIFQAGGTSAVAVRAIAAGGNSYQVQINVDYWVTAGTTSPILFDLRGGSSTTNTLSINGAVGARVFGGIETNSIEVTEHLP
jgi:hypothetical protein